ncbi:MAG TPA: HNH endonuclease signature motif containing protein [Dongiaceae bacterium]|nr:HNH endonuclease signature motif containing protein [Dongiaceae bacterium]
MTKRRLVTLSSRVQPLRQPLMAPRPKQRDPFYGSPEWRQLIAGIVKARGRRCEECTRTHDSEGKPIRVFGDHIVELKDGGAPLEDSNIKLLCGSCHTIKTNAKRAERAAKVW